MGLRIGLLAMIPALVLTTACGRVAPATLTGPSPIVPSPAPVRPQDFPSLAGRWRAVGSVLFRNLENGSTLTWGGCSGVFTVTAQDGATFTGRVDTQGSGWNSDRFCTAKGTFTGDLLVADGSVARARLEGDFQNWPRPSVTPVCQFVSPGDGVWTGTATIAEIRLQISDVLRCPVNGDGGLEGMPMAVFARTVSLTFRPW